FELMLSSTTPKHGPYGFLTKESVDRAAYLWTRNLSYIVASSLCWVSITEQGRSGYWGVHILLGGLRLKDINRLRPARMIWKTHHGPMRVQLITNLSGAITYITKHAGRQRFGDVRFSPDLERWRDRPGVLWSATPKVDRWTSNDFDDVRPGD